MQDCRVPSALLPLGYRQACGEVTLPQYAGQMLAAVDLPCIAAQREPGPIPERSRSQAIPKIWEIGTGLSEK